MSVPSFPKTFPQLETARLILRQISADDRAKRWSLPFRPRTNGVFSSNAVVVLKDLLSSAMRFIATT